MKTESLSNFDRALMEVPKPLARNRRERQRMWEEMLPEKRKLWEQSLHEELGFENRLLESKHLLWGDLEIELIVKEEYPEHYDPCNTEAFLKCYDGNIGHIFRTMHMIVYLESLLAVSIPEIDDVA